MTNEYTIQKLKSKIKKQLNSKIHFDNIMLLHNPYDRKDIYKENQWEAVALKIENKTLEFVVVEWNFENEECDCPSDYPWFESDLRKITRVGVYSWKDDFYLIEKELKAFKLC